MKPILAYPFAGAIAAFAATVAVAQTYSETFSTLGTQGDGSGTYFLTTHNASQRFNATGLSAVNQFELSLVGGTFGFYATEALALTFQINGVTVGTTTYNPGDSATRQLNFAFGSIASGTTDYTIRAFVSDSVCEGCGALQLSARSSFRLINATSVPEPSTWAMMLFGFAAVGFALRRSRKSGPPALPA